MRIAGDIKHGVKFTARALRCDHPVIKQRIKTISAIEYDLYIHESDCFDNSKPVFTIILTIHDANIKYIKESLTSVFGQNYRNTEVILINNGAHGEVGQLVWRAFLTNRNSKLILVPNNLVNFTASDLDNPIVNLWNAALFCSIGDFVYFLSYDDLLSTDYTERMVELFTANEKCATAAPSVASINEFSEINHDASESFRGGNSRGKYTDGLLLARSYMRGNNLIGFPGGLLAIKSNLVLSCGGFDDVSDLSQLFKFAINGESGFDPQAKLYWRHHSGQSNIMAKEMGLVHYKTYKMFAETYDIRRVHQEIAGVEFAEEFTRYITKASMEVAITSFRDSYRRGLGPGLRALGRVFAECPPWISARALLYLFADLPSVALMRLRRSVSRLLLSNHRFKGLLIRHIRNNRLRYLELRDVCGADCTFIERSDRASPPPLHLHDILNRAVHILAEEWRVDLGFTASSSRFRCLYDLSKDYLLLTSIARVLEARKIVEIGTGAGSSLWAWLRSEKVQTVSTWDVVPLKESTGWLQNTETRKFVEDSLLNDPRWTQYVEDISDSEVWFARVQLFVDADIIFINGPHDGIFEKKLIDGFLELQNESNILLIFDDIWASPMVNVWCDLPLAKLDATLVGHRSGTGLALLPPRAERVKP